MSTTPEFKNCKTCINSKNGKCPIECQLSPFCPMEAIKPVLGIIKRNKDQRRKLFAVHKN